jgi:hypothetical protein
MTAVNAKHKTTKGKFEFPWDGDKRYIPRAELVDVQWDWRSDRQKVESGTSFTVTHLGGTQTITTTEEWDLEFDYRIITMVIAKECDIAKTMSNAGDLKALTKYCNHLAKVETVANDRTGYKGVCQWGKNFRPIRGASPALDKAKGIMRVTLTIQDDERKEWLGYAVYRKETEKAALAVYEKAQDVAWEVLDRLGVV